MWEAVKEYSFVFGLIGGSLSAYLLGLLVNHLRRDKRWLGYFLTSRNIVSSDHSDLSVKYKGESIKRLDSYSVHVENIGNRPLVNIPVRVTGSSTTRIIETDTNAPEGMDFTESASGGSEVMFTFPLLNVGEVVIIELTVVDADEPLKLTSRVAEMTLVQLSPNIQTSEFFFEFLEAFPLPFLFGSNAAGAFRRLRDLRRQAR